VPKLILYDHNCDQYNQQKLTIRSYKTS